MPKKEMWTCLVRRCRIPIRAKPFVRLYLKWTRCSQQQSLRCAEFIVCKTNITAIL